MPKNNGVIGHWKCPEIRKGARQKWFKFRALWFWRHVQWLHMAGTAVRVPRVAGSCNIDSRHDIVKSSWKYRLLCCCVTRDVTQSNGLQECSFIFLFSVSCFDKEVIFFIFWGLFREKQNLAITEACPDCCLAKHEGNQMSGPGEDTFPKSKSRPPCSGPVNGGAYSIAFVSGQFVVDSGCIAATSQQGLAWGGECLQDEVQAVPGEKKERRTTRRRSIFRTMRFGAFFFRPRTSKKKAPKAGAHRSVTAWEKKVRLSFSPTTATNLSWEREVTRPQQRGAESRNFFACASAARAPRSCMVSHFTVSRACSLLYAHRARAWFRTSTRQKRALSLPSIGKEGADSLSKGIFLPMGDHGRLGSLRRAFSPLWRLSTSL